VISTAAAAAAATSQAQNQKIGDAEAAFQTALTIMGSVHIARDEGHGLYLFDGKVYRYDPEEMRLRYLVQEEVLTAHGVGFMKPGLVDAVIYHIRVNTALMEVRPEPGWLNLLNGRLNVATGDLEPHHPKHRTATLLPVVYDPSARCPMIERFCQQVFPDDAMAAGVPWEVAALCIHPFKGIDKAVLFAGEGENGKGIYLDLMKAFAGPENCSYVSLQKIGGNSFATSDMKGKLLNLCMDLPSQRLDDSGDFKAIVSGETIRAERKGQPAFHFDPYCRLLYSANTVPDSLDTSHGYVRRWHIIPFDRTFDRDNPERRPRAVIERETQTPEELSGLLNHTLPHIRRFLNGAAPRTTPSMDAAIEEFKAVLDPFPSWLRGALIADGQGFVPTERIQERYRDRSVRGMPQRQVSRKQIARAMQTEFPAAVADQRRVGGTGKGIGQSGGQTTTPGRPMRGWLGVSWRNPWP
jgi:putative DNA primase/helicase